LSRRKPQRLSIILGVYFIFQSVLLGVILLLWAYYTNITSINIELEKAFYQRQDIVEDILKQEAVRIDSALYELKTNKNLLDKLSMPQINQKSDVLTDYADKTALHKLDVLFISTTDNSVWLDASSPFPDVTPILDKLAASGRKYLAEARLDHFESNGVSFSGIFKSIKIVLEDGEVLGIAIGGTILNDNFSFMQKISQKSKTPTVILTENDKIISSFSSLNSNQLAEINNHTLVPCKHIDDDFHRLSNFDLLFVKSDIRFPSVNSNVSIFLCLADDVLTNLKQSYLYTLYSILAIIVFFLFSTFFVIQRLIYPSISRVLEYIEKISGNEKDVRLSSGSIIEMNRIGFALDKMVTSIHLSQKELEKSEKEFRSYIENAPNGIFISDSQRHYIEVNKAAEQITGFSRIELLKMRIEDLIPEQDKKTAFDHFQRVIEKGKSSGDTMFCRKNGSIGYWKVDATKLTNDRLLGFVSDISIRKSAENQIKSSLLEKEVLLREVHHRVKNNLQFIISLLDIEMQHHGKGSEIYKDTISRIRRFSIIYSKLYVQEDIANLNFAEILNETVEEILSMYSELNDGVFFKYDIPQPIIPIDKAIPLLLIINELVTNSIKYAFDTNGEINLVLHIDKEGSVIEFAYFDNGRGIQTEKTGFGTELVFHLANQLGLSIDISSDDGVCYKFKSEKSQPDTVQASNEILYVEDEFIIALSRIKALEKMGFNINHNVIPSGEKALKYIQNIDTLPSLILMDIGLAGELNGMETAREIRKKYDIPILFSSGYEDKAIRDEISQISNSGYIGKTCSEKELNEAISNLLI